MGGKPLWKGGSQAAILLSSLQIIFAVVIAVVTKLSLDNQTIPSGAKSCVLNLAPGRVCDFAYVTVGFGLFFSLVLLAAAAHAALAPRAGPGPLIAAPAIHLSLFACLWWFVFGMTVAIRGHQAADAGYPQGAARNAVVGLAWIVTAFYLFIAAAGVVDNAKNRVPADSDATATFLSKKEEDQVVATQIGSLQV